MKEPLCLWGGHPRLFEGGALSYSVPLLSKVMTGAVFMNQFVFLFVEMRKRIFSGRVDLRKHL